MKLAVALIHGIGDQPDSLMRTVTKPARRLVALRRRSRRGSRRVAFRACTGPAIWLPASWTTSSASASPWAALLRQALTLFLGGAALPAGRGYGTAYQLGSPMYAAGSGLARENRAADAAGDSRPSWASILSTIWGQKLNRTPGFLGRPLPRPGNPGRLVTFVCNIPLFTFAYEGLSIRFPPLPAPGHPPAGTLAERLRQPIRSGIRCVAESHRRPRGPRPAVGPWYKAAHPVEPHGVLERCALSRLPGGLPAPPVGCWPRACRRWPAPSPQASQGDRPLAELC